MCLLSTCILSVVCVVFFFKQKTAYEMRISDWSSDVCSSDLFGAENVANRHLVEKEEARPINGAPRLIVGSKPGDGGYFIFTPNELRQARERIACINAFVRPFIGAKEFLTGGTSYILAAQSAKSARIRACEPTADRVGRPRAWRM